MINSSIGNFALLSVKCFLKKIELMQSIESMEKWKFCRA